MAKYHGGERCGNAKTRSRQARLRGPFGREMLSRGGFEHILPISALRQMWCVTGLGQKLRDRVAARLEGRFSRHRREQRLDAMMFNTRVRF